MCLYTSHICFGDTRENALGDPCVKHPLFRSWILYMSTMTTPHVQKTFP